MDSADLALRRSLEATTLGDDGTSFFAAVCFLLRRDAYPRTARPTLEAAATHTAVAAHQLWALSACYFQDTAAPLLGDAWVVASSQLRSTREEDGDTPSSFDDYVFALHRQRRRADGIHVQAVADVLG